MVVVLPLKSILALMVYAYFVSLLAQIAIESSALPNDCVLHSI